jgi:hypothetical protein
MPQTKRQTRQLNCTCMLLHFLAVLKKQRDMIAFMAFALLSGKCVLKWLFTALYKVSTHLMMKHSNNILSF